MSCELPLKLSGRILVVDDSGNGRSIVSSVLRCLGLQTEEAQDGKIACEKAASAWDEGRAFDLILMDIHMPVMDGFAATSVLRRRGYTGRIAALTADTDAATRERCLAAGCDDYAAKPLDFKSLRDLVQRHVALAQRESMPESRPIRRTSRREPVAA